MPANVAIIKIPCPICGKKFALRYKNDATMWALLRPCVTGDGPARQELKEECPNHTGKSSAGRAEEWKFWKEIDPTPYLEIDRVDADGKVIGKVKDSGSARKWPLR